MTHIAHQLFYELLHSVRINMGAFMIKCMMLYKDESKKGLIYGWIFTRIFARNRVSFEGIIGIAPSEVDRIDCVFLTFSSRISW